MKRVYLLKNQEDHYKIGYSTRPARQRIKELETGSSSSIWLIYEFKSDYARKIEAALQSFYSSYKSEGGGKEWFNLPHDEALKFEERAKKIEDNLKAIDDAKKSVF